jgi:protocatechuate 3,4-dioxygenase beta subunit
MSTLYAQTTGTLLGTVSDQTGAVVPNAKVLLLNESRGDVRETTANEIGRFTFAGVQPGNYTVRVTMPDFKTWQRTGLS